MRTTAVILCTCLVFLFSCKQKNSLFESIPGSASGIRFVNKVEENDRYNVLEYMNIYTGAGVAAGDIDNDGLTDLFFSGNQTSGRLYKNKGNLQFEDITEKAGLLSDRWQTGVSMVDINQDGWLDIYINVSGSENFGNLSNLLYINNKNGSFSEKAAEYGIADKRLTMNASFFDYDKDGDLDLFLITNPADEMVSGINSLNDRKVNGESAGTDILYRNNGDGHFTDVSREAGILMDGYSLGAAISDVNNDGWPDIYVSNDFLTNDILYINNRNGTFTDETSKRLKHTSFASMGNDVADFNNDGFADIFVLDMLPEDNYRKKMIIPPASYDKFQLSLLKGYEPQYTRNTLQLNSGDGHFSDIAFLSGVSSTDWSWSALWADYDNDGDKDLMVTNGFYRDLGNLDYIHYQARMQNPMGKQTAKIADKLKAIRELASIPLPDYLYENNGDLRFTKRSADWGFTEPGFSNGACYADLDNDGDLELVINQFNSEAKLFRNHSNDLKKNHFLKVQLNGKAPNLQGIGAKLSLYTASGSQFLEFNPYRGFESTMEPVLHFGLGKETRADSLKIEWPDGKIQVVKNIPIDQLLKISYAPDGRQPSMETPNNTAIQNITQGLGLQYGHKENEFVDFKLQPLLPHMHSMNGPGIAVGDVNGDGLDDFYIGSASGAAGSVFQQTKNGQFKQVAIEGVKQSEDMGALLFDADNDADLDLYIVSGGSENMAGSEAQQDRLYTNDSKGNFTAARLPDTKASGSCVIASDFDRDGDLDLFVGGRVLPGNYPSPAHSYLLQNDTKLKDHPVFTDITPAALKNAGMVSAALWTDTDNDGWMDLIVAGEFMPIQLYKNNQGKLSAPAQNTGLENSSGWWNSISGADFDQDGDIDYVAGNLGLNTRHKASEQQPLCVYAKDYDKNGLIDPVMCYYVLGKNYIYPSRDEMIKQINSMRGRFPTYESYASVKFEESFTPQEISDAQIVRATCFETSYIENMGNGKFKRTALPLAAQVAPVFGIIPRDINEDGLADLVITGNSYATEASTGRYDAMKGLILVNDGNGVFHEDKHLSKGFIAEKDTKGTALMYSADDHPVLLVANNNDTLQAFSLPSSGNKIRLQDKDAYAIIHTTAGKQFRQEFYYGDNYLSSGSRKLEWTKNIQSIVIFDNKGKSRNGKKE
ncbi:VCBS repeat-containing protein [Flavihumibacter fluvii]|uniref:VCBS repeat-containing protein n=1 Tax=Flavihumibacter fluvii TaxID=2838157 RepID=UPI001BDF2902|nr:FG-GAP-like repeat-containing protein [Flavihumibacter fluvii]ULQ51303.1 VCBS repeat-containing protein [Flavihumibacter fluvii]